MGMTFTAGPYAISTLGDANDMSIDLGKDVIGVYAKSDLENADECPAALCFLNPVWGEETLNAALFAAAPDMLEALEHARDVLETAVRHVPDDGNAPSLMIIEQTDFDAAIKRIVAAISAAKGE